MSTEAAVGRLLSEAERSDWPQGGDLRSAFVFGRRHVLTAWHCVRPLGGTKARLWLRLQPQANTSADFIDVPVEYEAHCPALDAALLAVDESRIERLSGARLLEYLERIALPLASEVSAHDAVRVGGFPLRNAAHYATLYVGKVQTADQVIGNRPAVRVSADAFAARFAEWPDGMSGGPLLRRFPDGVERVVGIVTSYPRAVGDDGALGGSVICRRISDIGAVFPEVEEAESRTVAAVPGRAELPRAAVGLRAGAKVYISCGSGVPEPYRDVAADVCRRHGLVPVLPDGFSPERPPTVSERRRWIAECRIFVLLLGDRDGGCPSEDGADYTEWEYEAATADERIVVLPFLAGPKPVGSAPDTVVPERSVAEPRDLAVFRTRLEARHAARALSAPAKFREELFQAVTRHLAPSQIHRETDRRQWQAASRSLPAPPDMCALPVYIGGTPFTGRSPELADLDGWAQSADPVMVVDAIGGTGKSALTWQWATQHAPAVMNELAGSFWWSFYDGSAYMERFMYELLGYLRPDRSFDMRRVRRDHVPSLVINELSRRPFLVVLDGFERLLMAYHRCDPSKVTDDDVDADRRANKHAMIEGHGYDFVRRLVAAAPSKILVSTRMVPDALEGPGGGLLPGVRHMRLPGLSDRDVQELLGRLGVTGGTEEIREFFCPLGNHPLLITIVAGLVRDHRQAPGDFGSWRRAQPFEIHKVNLTARRNHVLAAALDGLDPAESRLLGWLSVLTGAVGWDLLSSINPYTELAEGRPDRAGALLDSALRSLEVRGLLWWNRTANTYDMHPVVRAYAHNRLDSSERIGANERIRDYFQANPPADLGQVTSVEDLQQTIALFRALTGAQQHREASSLWNRQLANPLLVGLGANATVAELLEPYEATGEIQMRACLSISLHLAGRHSRGLSLELALLGDLLALGDIHEVCTSLGRAATHYRSMGRLAMYAKALALLGMGQTREHHGDGLALRLRMAILEAISGDAVAARNALAVLDAASPMRSGNNPWFTSDVRYWRLVLEHRTGVGLEVAEIEQAERESSDWRNRVRLSALKFEMLVDKGDHLRAKSVADDIDRLRRVGGQEVLPAENALALAHLGRREEAAAAVEECRMAMPRLHESDHPHQLLATALELLGRDTEAMECALLARRRAWADGPRFTYRWDLERAELSLARLGARLAPLPDAGAERDAFPHQDGIERLLQGKNRGWRRRRWLVR
jgi:tetratricopeptide (TPR) repeat protein